MPKNRTLSQRIDELEKADQFMRTEFSEFTKEMRKSMKENTELTKSALEGVHRVDDRTRGVVEAFSSAQGGLRVLGILGKVAAALSALGTLGAAAWLMAMKWLTRG